MRIFAVREVSDYLNEMLSADEMLSDLWVDGEISNLVRSSAGHTYFTLKDANAQLRAVLFRRAARDPWLSHLENGVKVIVHGRLAVYEATGALQLYADLIQPEGVGLLHLQFEHLKTKLDQEGLFSIERKRAIPSFPSRIGVVTSPTGAVLHDILNVMSRRFPLVEIILSPAAVQGDGAVEEIVRAIESLNLLDSVDLIILARGGGSLEDLWSFNEEAVARAIFASRVPVVTGIGHETDYTIADMVADLRAPTPSAAAELSVPSLEALWEKIASWRRLLSTLVQAELTIRKSGVERLAQRMDRSAPPNEYVLQTILALGDRAAVSVQRAIESRLEQTNAALAQLRTLSPTSTLHRGYALVQEAESGKLVTSAAQVTGGSELDIRVSDGSFKGRVTE